MAGAAERCVNGGIDRQTDIGLTAVVKIHAVTLKQKMFSSLYEGT